MADLEDVTLDGRPLQSLRVADLKAALEERGLSKSGQKNALIKRLKGALMLEDLQRTSTNHIGLQPNSQIGEEMSQNSFIKQYLAKQQELLRQRLEREAREAYDTNDQEDHAEVNNSTSCPPQAQDVAPALAEQQKPPGPSGGESAANDGESNRNQEVDMPGPPASGSVAMRVPGGEQRPERGSASNQVAADSDDDDSEDDDGDDDDWDSGARRRNLREPARAPASRERSGASCQPPQQHMPSLLSPQLRQPTPPPSPPPELSFPLPDTPKQSPPSPDVAPARRSPSSSSSGSSSSGSRSSSPEPQRSGQAERKPGPLTLLARKMAKEGAFSGAGWHGGEGAGDRQQENSSLSSTSFLGRGPPEGLVSAITHTTNTAGHVPFPMIPGTNQGIAGSHLAHIQVPVSVLKATATEERDRERVAEIEKEKALELERQERQRKLEQERVMEEERERALERERIEQMQALERERQRQERELVLERERKERELALEQERQFAIERERQERELNLERERKERELALERERQERELALAKEREQALAQQRALELERQRLLEQERLQREKEERDKRERALELERARALEQERKEREWALEQDRLERERALEAERKEKERIHREIALEQDRLERERLEREKERIEREKALEQERLERERVVEQERRERERVVEQERRERERVLEQERIERERVVEQERRERVLEQERLERDRAIERERLEREKMEREKALEQQRLELERKEKENIERAKVLEQERVERERALERERKEKERAEREAALERERMEKEIAEKERKEREAREKALEQKKLERERVLEEERKEKERALELERLEKEKAAQKENEQKERVMEQEKERARMAEKERESHLPPFKRGREIGLTHLPTPPPPLSAGPARKSSTEAAEQEDVRALPAESSAPMSPTPLSPPSTFKKFRFLRDSPLLPQSSSTSMVIKRPRTFSDAPQPRPLPILSPTKVGDRQPEGHQPTVEHPQMQTKLEVVAGLQGSVETQPEKETAVSTTMAQSPIKEAAKSMVLEEKADSEKAEQAVEESTTKEVVETKSPLSPVDAAQRRGRDAKREEKQARRRSSSNDSSSSESDSGSSSSRSSGSSSSSQEKTSSTSRARKEQKPERDSSTQHRVTMKTPQASPCKKEMSVEKRDITAVGDSYTKKPFIEAPTRETQRKRTDSKGAEEKDTQRQVKETAMAEPEKLPETSEETPKAFSARKISLSSSKSSPGTGSAEVEQDSGASLGRKRRWGSSTAVTAKKPSISITTDSLKSLIPDIGPCLGQEAVVDLHPEEAVLSEAEDEERERSDQDLQIRRTVTQVVHSENQENGQMETKRSRCEELEDEDLQGDLEKTREREEKMDSSFPGAMDTQSPSHTSHDVEINTVTPSDTLIRRSISQQKTGVSITIDDPVRTARQPSPPRGKVSSIVHISNLVRPFTLGQLKELLSRTGTLVEEGFWIDKIKSHCFVTYCSPEEAVATRAALHGVKWPQSNPKVLNVDFCQQDQLDFHKVLGTASRPGAEEQGPGTGRGRASGLPSLLPERDQWAEREREMERRERARADREWDRDKVKPGEEKEGGPLRSRSRERRRKERGKSKEKRTEKKEKAAEDPPAKLLDDLFRKTKAAPCIYWLPLSEEQVVQREAARAERTKEREKQRKELEEEEKKREEERKERMKAGGGTAGERSEGEKDKERDRDRDRGRERENDKRRDGYRRPGGSGAGGGRRSRSRSDPRDRRR